MCPGAPSSSSPGGRAVDSGTAGVRRIYYWWASLLARILSFSARSATVHLAGGSSAPPRYLPGPTPVDRHRPSLDLTRAPLYGYFPTCIECASPWASEWEVTVLPAPPVLRRTSWRVSVADSKIKITVIIFIKNTAVDGNKNVYFTLRARKPTRRSVERVGVESKLPRAPRRLGPPRKCFTGPRSGSRRACQPVFFFEKLRKYYRFKFL